MASKAILTNINLNKNELQNAVIHPLATAPSGAKEGQFYYNTTDKLLYQYDGSNWNPVGAVLSVNGKTGIVVLTQDDVGDGTTYKRTHNDLTNALVALINGALQKSGGTMTGGINMGGYAITNVGAPSADADAATKQYVDAVAVGALQPKGSVTFANLPSLTAANLNTMYNVSDAFVSTSDFVDGAGVSYPANTNVAIINTGTAADPVYKYDAMPGATDLSVFLLKSGGTMTGAIAMGSNKITGLADGTASGDAATFGQLSGLIKTATGTIGTSATSATVAYSGTLINAYATMGGAEVLLDVAIGASSVTFTTAQAPSAAVTCVVVYS